MKLSCKSVGKDFGARRIFRDVNFEINSGQSLAITGPNGSGKTTLVRILCGLIRSNSGKIEYHNDQGVIPEEVIHHHIGLVGPYLELYEELTAHENMKFFARLKRVKDFDPLIHSLLKRMRLDGREDDPVKNYSSGMKQRLKYVFALLSRPDILFLDEPTVGLDRKSRDAIETMMKQFHESGKTVVFISHDMDQVARLAHRIVVLSKGRIVFDGAKDQLFQNQKSLDQFGLTMPKIPQFLKGLNKGNISIQTNIYGMQEAKAAIKKAFQKS